MNSTAPDSGPDQPGEAANRVRLGRGLRQAWVGYQRRLDQEMAAAGFGDRGFPDGRVLRICARAGATTIAQIGRELGITRQGAAKIVAGLRDRGYVTVDASATSGREKTVTLTPRAVEYLDAHRRAAGRIERAVLAELGTDGFESLSRLLHALGGEEQPRMLDYLRSSADLDALQTTED